MKAKKCFVEAPTKWITQNDNIFNIVSCFTKRIAAKILVIAKLNGRKGLVLRSYVYDMIFPWKQLPVQG